MRPVLGNYPVSILRKFLVIQSYIASQLKTRILKSIDLGLNPGCTTNYQLSDLGPTYLN